MRKSEKQFVLKGWFIGICFIFLMNLPVHAQNYMIGADLSFLKEAEDSGFLFKEKTKPLRLSKEMLPKEISLAHIALLKSGKDVYDEEGKLLYKNSEYT